MNLLSSVLLLAFLHSYVLGDIENGLQNLNISSELQSKLASNLQTAEELLKEKCRKNSQSEEAYPAAKQAMLDARECGSKFADLLQIQKDVEEKKKTGDLDMVFGKYCRKKSDLIACATNLKKAIEPCMDTEERSAANTAMNITSSLIDFACYRDGDRIALFIAEGGPECFNSSAPTIKNCIENTLGLNFNVEGEIPVLENLPNFAITPERCDKFTQLQECTVKELEKCTETTPGNIVDALFNFIRRRTPCGKKQG